MLAGIQADTYVCLSMSVPASVSAGLSRIGILLIHGFVRLGWIGFEAGLDIFCWELMGLYQSYHII